MKATELFVKYAESFGANGYRIESAGELAPALRTALSSNQLTIIDCSADASENLRLTTKGLNRPERGGKGGARSVESIRG